MTEKEIANKLCECIENAFDEYCNEVGVAEGEDGRMFFSDGHFHFVLRDGRLCKTPYIATDFMAIRFRQGEEIAAPHVVIYMKNGDGLYYYNFAWANYIGTAWRLCRVGREPLDDGAIFKLFATRGTAHEVKVVDTKRALRGKSRISSSSFRHILRPWMIGTSSS